MDMVYMKYSNYLEILRYATSTSATGNYGVWGNASGATTNRVGVYGNSIGSSTSAKNFGVFGAAKNAYQNYALYGESSGASTTSNSVVNHGVLGTASGNSSTSYATTNYGASATSSGNGASTSVKNKNFGIYASASGNYATNYAVRAAASGTNSTNYGIYASGSTYAGYFDGAVYVNGSITYTGSCTSSDERLKKNIQQLDGALDKVLKLRGVSYYWKNQDELKAMPNTMENDSTMYYQFDDKKQIGVIAQEMENVLPELVSTDHNGYKTVDYTKLTPILIEAMKEQQAIIEGQQQQLEAFKTDKANLQNKVESQQQQIDELRRLVEQLMNK